MVDADIPYSWSRHAERRLTERNIQRSWVALTITEPSLVEPHPEDPTCQCAYRVIAVAEGRVLKVVYNVTTDPWHIVTIHFDRRMRGQL